MDENTLLRLLNVFFSFILSCLPAKQQPEKNTIRSKVSKHKSNPVILVIFIFILISLRCDTTEPPHSKASLSLTLEDVSCTEAWLTLKSTNLQIPNSIVLTQNNQARLTINLTTTDTLLYIDSLLPNQTYKFQSVIPAGGGQAGSQSAVRSNELSVTTMDTTFHNFTWQTFTFGQHSSSVLYDVAIINENNIWAVGEIYMNDSLGNPDPTFYNAAHWNGTDWELKKIFYKGGIWSIRTIYAFNENDIWFSGYMRYLNGQFIELTIPSILMGWQINKLWGSSCNDLYAVGNNGNIAHYNGSNWTKIESGTTVDIQDIWGIEDKDNNNPFILCAVSYVAQLGEQKILRITNTKTDTLNWGTGRRVHSIWFDNDKKLYACGGGVFFSSAPNNDWVEQTDVPLFFTERIRGKGKNDLFTVGHYGLLAHFNGTSWKTYPEASTAVVYNSLVYKNNLIAITGYTETKAVVQFMQHN